MEQEGNMKGIWRTSTNVVGGKEMYQVFRSLNYEEPDHSGNREVAATLAAEDEALIMAAKMNEAEGLHVWVMSYLIRRKCKADDILNYTVEGYRTAVVSKRIKDAFIVGLGAVIGLHYAKVEDIFITSIDIADAEAGALVGKAREDPLADCIWPEMG